MDLEIATIGTTIIVAIPPKLSRKPHAAVHTAFPSTDSSLLLRTAIPAKLRVDNLHYDLTEDDLYVSRSIQLEERCSY